jgi:hypothetical protein
MLLKDRLLAELLGTFGLVLVSLVYRWLGQEVVA